MGITKIQNFCFAKVPVKREEKQTKGWEKIFIKHHLIKDLYLKYIRNFQEHIKKKSN